MAIKIIESIKETEKSADRTVRQSLEKARRMMADAQKQASDIIQEKKQEAAAEVRKIIDMAERDAREKAELISLKVSEECQAIKENARQNMDSAVEAVIKRIVNTSGSS